MRIMVVALWALLTLALIQGASAQNGLQRFESEVKPQLEFKSFTYGSSAGTGPLGLRAEQRGGRDPCHFGDRR